MQKIFFPFFLICLLIVATASGVDPRAAHVMAQLQFLPLWCQPSLFFLKDGGAVFDGYRIEKEMDGCGHVVGVTLVRDRDGSVEERVDATWESGCSMDRLVRVAGDGITHLFEYDEHDCAVRHVLVGNLSGKSDACEEYETIFRFDASFRPIEIQEENGKVQLLKYPDTVNPFVVVVERGVGRAVRQAVFNGDFEFEQIEDDGWTVDINDLSHVSWRRWKKACVEDSWGKICQTVTIGAYDPKKGQDVVLRRESSLLATNGDVLKTEVFDSDGALVSTTLGRQDGCHLDPSSIDDIREFIREILSGIPSKAVPTKKPFEGGGELVYARNTSRRQWASVIYKDGTQESCEYDRDGSLSQIVYRDGRRVVVKRECGGRLLSALEWEAGAVAASHTTNEYQGPFLSAWMTDGVAECRMGRDCFGRVTTIDIKGKDGASGYAIRYDLLDRVIGVEVTGRDAWSYERLFSVDGTEVTTEYTNGGVTTVVHEARSPEGAVQTREEEAAPGQSFLYSYDTEGRLLRIDRSFDGKNSMIVEKQYVKAVDGTLYQETSSFSDGTTQIEERRDAGKLLRHIWTNADGTTALEEKTISTDDRGSKSVQRTAGTEVSTVEWKVGDNGHLTQVGGTTFEYDPSGRCIVKRSAMGHEVHYEWNAKRQMKRQFCVDGSIDYRFSYDDKGRICRAFDAVAQKAVIRSFDSKGRLASDGETASHVQGTYDDTGALLRLELPGGAVLRYDGQRVYKEGEGRAWNVETGTTKSVLGKTALMCFEVGEMEFQDPLGCWKERFSYDALNQLQGEEGEFQLSYGFDAFGIAKTTAASCRDGDGNVVASDNVIFEYDALGRLIVNKVGDDEECYRYDGFGRVQEITTKGGKTKRLCWLGGCELGALEKKCLTQLKVPHPVSLQPVAIEVGATPFRVECDARGSISALYDLSSNALCEVYRYSAFGALHVYGSSLDALRKEAISPWLYCGKRLLKATYDFGSRRYSVHLQRWLERDPLGIVDTADDRMYVRNNPVAFVDPTGLFPVLIDWSEICNSISHAVQCIASRAYKTITFAKERLDWLFEFQSTYEDVVFHLLGRAWLRCSGYNLDSTSSFVYGDGEERTNVRITLINGILNGAPEARKSAALLSSTHGHIPVHFVYAATQGFSGDMLRGAFAKAGIVSLQANLLVDLWHELIDEMGGVSGGGTILHYAHSLGATDTLNALQLLTPEERSLIRIATFGSPTLLDDGVCGKVDNYVSVKDGVPIIDFHRYAAGAQGIRPNVHFIPSDGTIPLVDHYFDGKTYTGVLELLGQKFQEEFLLVQ